MTDRSRRRLLAAIGTGLAAGLAGCGYQPAAGEFDWDASVPSPHGPFGGGSRRWLAGGDRLLSVRNRDGRTYDFDAERWVDLDDAAVAAYDEDGDRIGIGTTGRRYEGRPAVGDDAVFLPLENGAVSALSWTDGGDEPLWTTARTGPARNLHAGGGIVVAVREGAGGRRDGSGDDGRGDDRDDGGLDDGNRDDGGEVSRREEDVVAIDAPTGEELFSIDVETLAIDGVAAADVGGGVVWTIGGDGTLYGFDADGTTRVERSVDVETSFSAGPQWLVATADGCIVDRGDRCSLVAPDGERRWTAALGRPSARPIRAGDRLYVLADGTVAAVDATAGDVRWRRDAPFSEHVVADAAGIYGLAVETTERGSGRRSGSRVRREECRIAGVTADGGDAWDVAVPEDADCGGELFVVGDRLVVVGDSRLYGFHRTPGDRRSIL